MYHLYVLQKDTIETTRAGDTFMACVLNWSLNYGIDGMAIFSFDKGIFSK